MRSYGILLRLSLKNTLASFRTGVTSRKTGKISIGFVLLAIIGCAGLLGLAVALAEMCIGGRLGANIDLDAVPAMEDMTLTELLYSESASRLIVSVRPDLAMILDMLGSWQICRRIGTVTDDNTLTMTRGGVTVLQESVDDLTTAFKRTLDW